MQVKPGLFWLSSYPKSGNTWFRIVLANLLKETDDPVDINHIHTGHIASSRSLIDHVLGFDSANLTHDEIDALRPSIYTWHSKQLKKTGYHKIHDAYTFVDNGVPMIPTEGCLGVLYFIRNPLDIALSFANHLSCSIDQAIDIMGNKEFSWCKNRHKQYDQIRQRLLSWSLHVQSWVNAEKLNVLVLRYEDMKQKPFEAFSAAVHFLRLTVSTDRLQRSIDNASIEKLQQQEMQFGFSEKPPNSERFFRKGIVNDWQTQLTSTQIEKIISDHGEIMAKYGYIDAHK